MTIITEKCDICGGDIIAGFLPTHRRRVHPEQYGQPEHGNGIQMYSEHSKKLMYSQANKVRKFLENRCVEYAGGGVYVCKPLEHYNKTTYRMMKGDAGEFTCTCQHNVTEGTLCSHLGALYEFFRMGQDYGHVISVIA